MAATAAASANLLPGAVSRSSFLDGVSSSSGSDRGIASKVDLGHARVTCKKDGIHPKYFPEAKVFCNGEHVISVGGTQESYVVDVWSGNHPFFQGNKTALVLDADRLDKFKKKYGDILTLNEIPVLERGEIVFEKKRKAGKGKGGKK